MAYEPKNNTLQTGYRFQKPITITLVYDVRQMLKLNKKIVSDEVTKEDIDPVLLLWDNVNQTWYLEIIKHFIIYLFVLLINQSFLVFLYNSTFRPGLVLAY